MSQNELPPGFVSGNVYDKFGSRNPIVRMMMNGFLRAFEDLLRGRDVKRILEVGCGEGEMGKRLAALYPGAEYLGIDIAPDVIAEARSRYSALHFEVCPIDRLEETRFLPDLVVATEVFEHLDQPLEALDRILELPLQYLLLSVPREPVWRFLNVARGKYLADLGNTPGHVNHWSKRKFLSFLQQRADSLELGRVRSPFPWTMVLCCRRVDLQSKQPRDSQ